MFNSNEKAVSAYKKCIFFQKRRLFLFMWHINKVFLTIYEMMVNVLKYGNILHDKIIIT